MQALKPPKKKVRATRSRGVGLLPQRTGAVITRQTVMTHCSPMTCLKMMMMVTSMHIELRHPVLCCFYLDSGQTRRELLSCTLIAVRKCMADTYRTPTISMAQHGVTQHSTAQHSTAQHSTAQHSAAQHSAAQRGKLTYASQALCKE